MNGKSRILLSALALTCLVTMLPAQAQQEQQIDRRGDLVSVFSGDIHVPANVRQIGSVVCIGGDVRIEGHVTKDAVSILGSLEITGTVDGTVTGVLSDVELRNAEIGRELVSVLGSLELENTHVSHEMINILGALDRDELSRVTGELVNIGLGSWAPSFWAMLFWLRLFHKFVIFVLILLLVALIPDRIRAIGEEAPVRYVPAFFVGLLAYLGMLVLSTVLLATVVGFPLAMVIFYIFKWLGVASIFYAVGHRLGRTAGYEMSLLGAVLVSFALYLVLFLTPSALGLGGLLLIFALRIVFWLLIEVPAVGLVILTRAGSPRRPGPAVQPPVAPGPAAGAPPPP